MITNKLSKRMKQICQFVDGGVVADIGCDHGKIMNKLLKDGIVKYAICSDISQQSAEKARQLFAINLIDPSRYEIIYGDGFENIDTSKLDCAIIAGMGGEEIIKIISATKSLPKTLILQPQKHEIDVKKYVLTRGYAIVGDIIIYDVGKFYNVIKCQYVGDVQQIAEFDILFGKDNFANNADFGLYIQYMRNKCLALVGKNATLNGMKVEDYLTYIDLADSKWRKNNE